MKTTGTGKRKGSKKRVSRTTTRRKASTRRPIVLDGDLKKMIRQEARKFGISEEEYLRLVVHFSEAVTTQVLPAGLLDGNLLKMIISNPMVLNMLKGMVGNVMSRMGSGGSKSDGNASGQGQQTAPQQVPGGHPHGFGMPGGGMPMPGMQGFPPGMQGHGPGGGPPMGMIQRMMPGMNLPGMPGGGSGDGNGGGESSEGGGFSLDGIANMMSQMFGK
ncbi:MAG TPA: hypothetical protein VFV52_04420 [Bacilli bacterium]|nr:hypothetical protein [Bacilli bacterium]